MKIAIDVSQTIYDTGASKYTKHLVSNLLKLSSDSFTLFGGSLRRKNELDNWIRRIKPTAKRTYYLSPVFLNHLWNTFHIIPIDLLVGKVDLIHTSDWTEPPSKTIKVTTVHDLNFLVNPTYAKPSIKTVQTKRLYWVKRECKRIIAVSNATKADLVEYLQIDPEKIEVIYEGPTIEYPPVFSADEAQAVFVKYKITKPYIVVPGCGHPRKNIKNAVTAFKLLKSKYQLVVIGRPDEPEKVFASDSVILTGFVSDREFEILVSSAQSLFYPSLYEGFGLPILDAFVCGVPVVTSNKSSMAEVGGLAAYQANPEEPEDLALGLKSVLEHRQDYIKAGINRAKKFSWKQTAQETLDLYHQVYKKYANRY